MVIPFTVWEGTVGSNLMLHCGAKETDRASLSLVEPPPATATWFPVKHATVLDLVGGMLEHSGFRIKTERLGLSREGHRFFGTLDLETPLVEGITGLSVGIRNSTDMSFPLGFCAGSRTFVCDNLSFSADLVVKRKHTINGEARFREAISLAVQSLDQFREAETRRIEFMRATVLPPNAAEAWMIEAFTRGLVSTRILPHVIRQWREPEHDWGQRGTLWHLLNAFTTPIQQHAKTNPQRFAMLTMSLMGMLGPKVVK